MKAEFTPDGGEPIDLGEVKLIFISHSKKYQPICPLEEISPASQLQLTAMMSKWLQNQHEAMLHRIMWNEMEAEGWRELNGLFGDDNQ